MNVAMQRDIGAYLKAVKALNPNTATAGAGTDGAETNGHAFDRLDDVNDYYLSCKVVLPYSGSLASGKTATLKFNAQHSDSTASGWADYNDKDGSTAVSVSLGSTGSTATQTVNGVLTGDFDLSNAKRYFRIQVTPTLSATATDTLLSAGTIVLGPGNDLPAD